MSPADLRIILMSRDGIFARTEHVATPVAREIANVLHQRTLDGLATTLDDLVAMGQWSRAVIQAELATAEELARADALNFGVV